MFIEYCEDIVKIVETIKQEFEFSLSDKFIEEFNEKNTCTNLCKMIFCAPKVRV